MEILCDACHAKLTIPDEKLPQGQRVGVKCPRCGNKLIIDVPPAHSEKGAPPEEQETHGSGDSGQKSATPPEMASYDPPPSEDVPGLDDQEADRALASYGEGESLALIMIPGAYPSDDLKEVLNKLGYNAIQAGNTREAIAKMRLQHFDLIVLSDLFDDIPLNGSPVMQYLNHLSMSVRRRTFLLLMSDAFRTMDHMMAFALSANLVANWKDLDRLSSILGRALSDNERFYKVFMDALKETGRA
jgi:predicted Zn finger-like uncharacterized protein